MANLTFLPSAKPTTNALTMEDITDEVKNDVEEVYKALKTQTGRMRVEFPSAGELNAYVAMVKAYCSLRPEGELRFRKSPARGLQPTQMEFRITDPLTENEKDTEEIREGVEKVKAAATSKK